MQTQPDTTPQPGRDALEILLDALVESVEKSCEHPTLNLDEELVRPAREAVTKYVRSLRGD